ncbi:anti-sigma factor family protein [Scleromatobacter humisilvae]|uniref:Anti-sigma factor n=1 Tax=Scleromatobacter humisilvae TaxID=2897159 RepID=A0A9X2BY09_9BURK|nr:hypothetical protein [Scleromatobacter humisilvae]MCK9685158.1 hypothetical protein [Scleromatobacter humisilvae]
MESNFESQRLSAFLDGALDESQQRATRAALRSDAGLRSELHALRRVRDAVHAHAVLYPAPERLAERLRLAAVLARGAAPAPRPARWRFGWARAAAAIAVAGLAAWGLVAFMPKADPDERLMDAAVTSHVRATRQARLVDLSSPDRGAVAAWLSTRLPFYASPGADNSVVEAGLLGGRIDSLEGRSTAAMVYRLDGHVVDVFVLPMTTGDDAVSTSSLRGYTVSHWTHGGLRWCVVSDLSRKPLAAFVEGLRQAVDAS